MYKYEHILNFFWSLRTDNKCSLHLKSFPACLTYLLANPLTFCLKPTHYPLSNPPTSFQTHYPFQTHLPPTKPAYLLPNPWYLLPNPLTNFKPTYLLPNPLTSFPTPLPTKFTYLLPYLLTSCQIHLFLPKHLPPAKPTYLLPNLYFLPTQSTSC